VEEELVEGEDQHQQARQQRQMRWHKSHPQSFSPRGKKKIGFFNLRSTVE
jgi:hypothetical protein